MKLTFAESLKQLRARTGLTQTELAEEIVPEWKKSRIGNYESGARTPSYDDLELISKYFEGLYGLEAVCLLKTGLPISEFSKDASTDLVSKEEVISKLKDSLQHATQFKVIEFHRGFDADQFVDSVIEKLSSSEHQKTSHEAQ